MALAQVRNKVALILILSRCTMPIRIPFFQTTKIGNAHQTSITATIQSHYEDHTNDSYENAFFYEPGVYTDYMCNLVRDRLRLTVGTETETRSSINSSSDVVSEGDEKSSSITGIGLGDVDDQKKRRRRGRVLLDIGGGTGNFARMLVKDTDIEAVVVDPYLVEETTTVHGNDNNYRGQIRFVKQSAQDFVLTGDTNDQGSGSSSNGGTSVESGKEYNNMPSWRHQDCQVLLKEVCHHFSDSDRKRIFQGFYNGLTTFSAVQDDGTPSVLIITRPQREIDYPLWDQARDVWARNQPSCEQFVEELKLAGFVNIQHSIETYPCEIPLERWQSMIRQRFWSTFSNFTDDDLNEACQKIAETETDRIDKNGVLHFEDRLLFITAEK